MLHWPASTQTICNKVRTTFWSEDWSLSSSQHRALTCFDPVTTVISSSSYRQRFLSLRLPILRTHVWKLNRLHSNSDLFPIAMLYNKRKVYSGFLFLALTSFLDEVTSSQTTSIQSIPLPLMVEHKEEEEEASRLFNNHLQTFTETYRRLKVHSFYY